MINSPVLKIDHIAIVSKQSNKIKRLFEKMGLAKRAEGLVQEIKVNCEYYSFSNIDIEIVSPTEQDSIVINHFNKNLTTPLHHIALEVTSLNEGIAYFQSLGYKLIDGSIYRAPKNDHKVVFLSPYQTGNLLIELVSDHE